MRRYTIIGVIALATSLAASQMLAKVHNEPAGGTAPTLEKAVPQPGTADNRQGGDFRINAIPQPPRPQACRPIQKSR